MEDVNSRLTALEKRVAALENARVGKAPLTWQQKANIKFEEYSGLKPDEVAQKYHVSVATVYKIYSERNAAELEFERVTGLPVTPKTWDEFIAWRKIELP